jgi:fatty acid-binding protein DegV
LVKVKPQYVYYVRWIDKNKEPSKIVKAIKETKAELKALFPQSDPVNHPAHYKAGGVETIDFIEAKDLNYRLGNVVKYVSRAGKKNSDPVQDLEKAAWYLNREIEARKSA